MVLPTANVFANLTAEFDYFEKIPITNVDCDSTLNQIQKALVFFKQHRNSVPYLSKLLRIILSVPATSVPSESLFSQAGFIQNDYRNRLSSNILNMLNFIKSNM